MKCCITKSNNPATIPETKVTEISLLKRSTIPQWQGKPLAWRVLCAEWCARDRRESHEIQKNQSKLMATRASQFAVKMVETMWVDEIAVEADVDLHSQL